MRCVPCPNGVSAFDIQAAYQVEPHASRILPPHTVAGKDVVAMANPQHKTLVANTVSTVTLDADYDEVEVTNVDGAAAVYFTTDGSTPAVGADGSHVLPAAIGFVQLRPRTSGATVVKAISVGTPKISVRGVPSR